MRGADLINAALPDDLLDDVIHRVSGAKRDLDACALVCRRWRRLERASRRSARLAASGERADEVLRLIAERFTALAEVSVDERLTATGAAGGASGSGSASRSYHRSGMERGPYHTGMLAVNLTMNGMELLLSQLSGKDTELIAAGREKFASVPCGGGGVAVAVAAPAAGEAAPADEVKKEEKVEEKEESDDVSRRKKHGQSVYCKHR